MNKQILISIFVTLTCVNIVRAQLPEQSDSLVNELQEIVVKANNPVTKLVGNSLVSTVAGSPLQNLGNCLDVLGQLPLISIHDDAVEVMGKGNPEIYIDGRPLRDAIELQQLQSTDIKRVELLLAPGATYASHTQAVLKITTRKSFIQGLSFTDKAEVKVRRKCSANDLLDVNYRTGKWDIFAAATVAHNNSMIKGTTTNKFIFNGVNTIVGSSQSNVYLSNNATIKTGFNYAAGSQSFGAYYRYNPEKANFENNGTEWLNDEAPVMRIIQKDTRANSHLASIYYDNTFHDKYHLHFDGNYRKSLSTGDTDTSYPKLEIPDICSHDSRSSTLWAGKATFDFPLWQGSLVVGTQDSYTRTSLDYRMLSPSVGEYIPSSFTVARQTSLAGFASWERTFGIFNLNVGLRYEYVDYIFNINEKKDSDLSRKHNTLTPDISLSWMFNEKSQVSLSYRMATLKPPYSQLTGNLSYVGMHEIEGGNPTLRDERMHDVQLFGMWNGFMFQADYTRSI
ncbi:MAG: TonB-dependent receptor, partial [Muribaculaceae bacterium]|nr:TonB-dependent receptor [Muribaculaceae bacterium]